MNTQEDHSAQSLAKLITAKWTTHLVASAAELGLADLLKDGPMCVSELAERTQSNPAMLYRLLRALTSLGLFRETEAKDFALTPMGEPLRRDTKGSMRALAIMLARPWHDQAWEQLTESIRTGRSAAELAFGTDLWRHL